MLKSLVYLQQGNVKKSKRLMKLVMMKKSSYLPNDMKNLNEIFTKNVSYDNIECHKKPGLCPFVENTVDKTEKKNL